MKIWMKILKKMTIIRKKQLNILYGTYMDNIIDTFKINTSIINENEILKESESKDDSNMDLIIKKKN